MLPFLPLLLIFASVVCIIALERRSIRLSKEGVSARPPQDISKLYRDIARSDLPRHLVAKVWEGFSDALKVPPEKMRAFDPLSMYTDPLEPPPTRVDTLFDMVLETQKNASKHPLTLGDLLISAVEARCLEETADGKLDNSAL